MDTEIFILIEDIFNKRKKDYNLRDIAEKRVYKTKTIDVIFERVLLFIKQFFLWVLSVLLWGLKDYKLL